MCPSALPLCPGLEVILARTLSVANCSATKLSMTLSLLRVSCFLCTLLDFLTSGAASYRLILFKYLLGLLLGTQVNVVLLQVPLLEGSSIDLNDGSSSECFGSNELIVGWVIDSVNDLGLEGGALASPCEVTLTQTECSELEVASSHSDASHSLLA